MNTHKFSKHNMDNYVENILAEVCTSRIDTFNRYLFQMKTWNAKINIFLICCFI